MEMITLYGIQSPHVARVRAALIQKELEFQHVSVNLGNKSEDFKKLSPIEQIPVLEDEDGTVVYDSIHIIDYLDFKYPDTYRMISEDPEERAKILNVIALAIKVTQYVGPLYVEKFNLAEMVNGRGESFRGFVYTEKQKEDFKKDVHYRSSKLKEMLGKNKFFTGKFSAADATVLGMVSSLEYLGIPVPEWKQWKENLMKDKKIASMFAPQDEKGIKEI